MKHKIEPVVIRCINDIRKAIVPFTKEVKQDVVEIKQVMEWEDDGTKSSAEVSANSNDITIRQLLLNGFEQVKQHEHMLTHLHDALEDDEYAPVLPAVNVDKVPMVVDKLIRNRLGGKRRGMTVVWEIGDKEIVFDPYTKELHESVK